MAIVSLRGARLPRGGAGGLAEFAAITDQLNHSHEVLSTLEQ